MLGYRGDKPPRCELPPYTNERRTGAIARLGTLVGGIVDLRHAASLIGWDEHVSMPRAESRNGGWPRRSRHCQREVHVRRAWGALDAAAREATSLPPDSEPARLVKVTARDYDRAVRVPSEFVAEQAHVASAAHQAWKDARAQSSYAVFQPHFEKVVRLGQQYAAFFQPVAHPYDALIDTYEPGILTSEIQAIFDVLRPRQVELVREIQARPVEQAPFLNAGYDEREMLAFSTEVISAFGFDWTRGRQDKSTHPFAVPIGSDDVRMTTRFDHRYRSMLFAAMHETGHALYEQGVSRVWARTLVGGGASQGVTNRRAYVGELIGRSRPFGSLFPSCSTVPSPLAASRSTSSSRHQPGEAIAVRVEADEVTYNLTSCCAGDRIALLTAEFYHDAPAYWNTKHREYLGVVPDTDASGILQDMHWSIGFSGTSDLTLESDLGAAVGEIQGRRSIVGRADSARRIGPLREWLRRRSISTAAVISARSRHAHHRPSRVDGAVSGISRVEDGELYGLPRQYGHDSSGITA